MRIDLHLADGAGPALAALARAGEDLEPAMQAVGEALLVSARRRFGEAAAPDGTPWAPLSETTKRRKRRNRDKVLVEEGRLLGTLAYRAARDSLEVGSPLVYAGVHQFGQEAGESGFWSDGRRGGPIPWGDIPARPFLGLDDGDRRDIADAVNAHLRLAALRGIGSR